MKPKKTGTRVGLDIGTRMVKALELSMEGDVQRLTKLHSTEIAFPLARDNTTAALKSLLENLRPSVKDVNISLSAPSAIVRFINMPKMTETDLKNSLRFEAEKYIPFNIKEVVTDATILAATGEDKKQMRVLFAAVKRKAVDTQITALKNFGLAPSIIDIDSFACFNAFCNSSGTIEASRNIALLNIGYTQTNLVISEGENPFFTRDIQIGTRDMAKVISEKLGAKEEESDRLLFDPKEKEANVRELSKSVLNNLLDELRLSFGYYENQHGRAINEIYISGGASRLGGIAKYFEESFDIKTALWNPFSKFEISQGIDVKWLEPVRGQFAVAAGLAIRR
jgi:type IV pilus assembly protein PilM